MWLYWTCHDILLHIQAWLLYIILPQLWDLFLFSSIQAFCYAAHVDVHKNVNLMIGRFIMKCACPTQLVQQFLTEHIVSPNLALCVSLASNLVMSWKYMRKWDQLNTIQWSSDGHSKMLVLLALTGMVEQVHKCWGSLP